MVEPDILVTPDSLAVTQAVTSEYDTTAEPPETVRENAAENADDTSVPVTDEELKALIDGGMEGFGMAVSIKDLTRAGMTLHYELIENYPYAEMVWFEWGPWYELQQPDGNGGWNTYDPENVEKTGRRDSLYTLGMFSESDNWVDEKIRFYGSGEYESEIPNGKYRIVQSLSLHSKATGKVLGYLPYIEEFDMTDSVPTLFGITMTAKDVTPESVTLVVRQSGGNFHVKRDFGYESPYYILHKTESGEWEELEYNPTTWAPDIEPMKWNDTTEITVNFGRQYGSLPNGTYRISQTFVNYSVSSGGEQSVINRSTYFCDFEITGGENTKWKITMSADNITAEGLTLTISENGGIYPGEITYGEEFAVEKRNGDDWEQLPFVHDNWGFIDLGYLLDKNAVREETVTWKYMHGALPAGHYRIKKGFFSGDYRNNTNIYAEFEITDDIGSKLGVTMRRNDNTNKRIEFTVSQNGGTVDGDIMYTPAYRIEKKNGGKWEELPTLTGEPAVWNAKDQVLERGSEITLGADFDMIYGELPEGEYRLVKDFVCGSITETVYADFTVTVNMTNAYGLGLKVYEASAEGLGLEISQSGGEYKGSLYRYKGYTIFRSTDGHAEQVFSTLTDTGERNSVLKSIAMAEEVNWSEVYGKLASGKYIIELSFLAKGDEESMLAGDFQMTARFEIK